MPHRITASIRPHVLDDVVAALDDVGLHEVVVAEVKGFSGRARRRVYRGVEYVDLDDRVLLDVIDDRSSPSLIATLISVTARTGHPGDGRVWSAPLDLSIDIGTGSADASNAARRARRR